MGRGGGEQIRDFLCTNESGEDKFVPPVPGAVDAPDGGNPFVVVDGRGECEGIGVVVEDISPEKITSI